jgi:hypothetical protein
MIAKTGIIQTNNFYENSGSSTYTVVGSLTNNKGIFSGFTSSNYINTNCTISAFADKLEIYGSYTTGTDVASEQHIIATDPRNLAFETYSSKLRLCIYSNNSSWGVLASGTTTLTANTKYIYKIISNNTAIKVYLLLNGNWVTEISATLPTASTEGPLTFGVLPGNKNYPIKGSVDIKDYEIKVSGKTIWSGINAYLGSITAKMGSDFVSAIHLEEI